jgi:hypothetical protein
MAETPTDRETCEHHWESRHQPDFPAALYWVEVCSLCGRINGAALTAALAAQPPKETGIPTVDKDERIVNPDE